MFNEKQKHQIVEQSVRFLTLWLEEPICDRIGFVSIHFYSTEKVKYKFNKGCKEKFQELVRQKLYSMLETQNEFTIVNYQKNDSFFDDILSECGIDIDMSWCSILRLKNRILMGGTQFWKSYITLNGEIGYKPVYREVLLFPMMIGYLNENGKTFPVFDDIFKINPQSQYDFGPLYECLTFEDINNNMSESIYRSFMKNTPDYNLRLYLGEIVTQKKEILEFFDNR